MAPIALGSRAMGMLWGVAQILAIEIYSRAAAGGSIASMGFLLGTMQMREASYDVIDRVLLYSLCKGTPCENSRGGRSY